MKSKYKLFHGNDFEDRYLVVNYDLPDKGVFVDIGAGPDGIQGSNSYHFEKNGWKVICAEADPRNYNPIMLNRKNAYFGVISSIPGKVKFNLGNESNDVSGILRSESNGNKVIELPSITLERLLELFKVKHVDILSIDTEGTEYDVFSTIGTIRPRLLIIEVITQGMFNLAIEQQICDYGYHVMAEIGANLIFEKNEA